MKKIISLILLTIWLSGSVHAQQKKLRIAFVDMEMILDSMPQYREAMAELDARVRNWKLQLDKMEAEIQALKQELEAEKLMLTEDLLREKEEIIRFKEEKKLKYQMDKFGPQGDYVLQKQAVLKPIQDRVFNAVAKMVQLRQYDVVFDKSNPNAGIIHASPALDITPQVIKILKREHQTATAKQKIKQKTDEIKAKYEEHKQQWKETKTNKTDNSSRKQKKKTLEELYKERKRKWEEQRRQQEQQEQQKQ